MLYSSKTKKDKIIFIDIDGVLGDWIGNACKTLALDIKDDRIRKQLKNGKKIEKLDSVDIDELWNKINKLGASWWEDIPLFSWAKDLIKEMQRIGEVCVLTSPGLDPESCSNACAGKVLWMAKHFPDIPYIIAHDKWLCASKKAILIDDSKKKIKAFKKANGKVFLWPNQYKIEDGDVPLESLINTLKRLI